jgi:preprotein translocase SecE subunit
MTIADRFRDIRTGTTAKREPREPRSNPVQYVREVRDELAKVTWPKRQEVVQGTIRVIIVSAFFVLLLGGLDFFAQRGLDKILSRELETAPATDVTTPDTQSSPIELPEGIPPPPGLETETTGT